MWAERFGALTEGQQLLVLREMLNDVNRHRHPEWMEAFVDTKRGDSRWTHTVLALFWTGAVLAGLSHIPQLARPIILRDAHEISLLFVVLTLLALVFRLLYSCMMGAVNNACALSVTVAIYAALLGIKVFFSYTHCDPDRKQLDRSRYSPLMQEFLFGSITTGRRRRGA